jgi:hypothetical protein
MAIGVQNISLTDYDSQMADIARRQRMALALQEQAAAPIEIQSYKGIQAPIPTLSILSKALKSYVGARGERKASEEKGLLEKLAREQAIARGLSYLPTEETANPPAIAPQALAAALENQPVLDTQSGASRNAGIVSNPAAVSAPPPPSPPPNMVSNTQSGASLAAGIASNPNAAPRVAPPAAGAMVPVAAPPTRPAGPSTSQLQAGLNKAILDANNDPNPYVRQNAARMIPVIQDQISRSRQLSDVAETRAYNQSVLNEERAYQDTHAESLRAKDIERASQQADAIISNGNFTDNQVNAIRAAAAAGTEALNAVRSLAASKAWVAKNTVLSQQEIQRLGFPAGSIVSQNDETGAVDLVYNPNPDKTAEYNARTARINATTKQAGAQVLGGSTPEGRAAIAKAVAENRLDAARVNSRNQALYETTLLQNPNMNFMNNHALAAIMSNAPTQQKNIALQALPDVIENVKLAGQKLNYSNFSPVGRAQSWARGITNDPDYRNYMAQRNDAMMAIGNAMRMIGMSDKSIDQEIKAAPESMSPRAFEAWAEGQLTALQPRLERLSAYSVNTDASNNINPQEKPSNQNAATGAGNAPLWKLRR